jgi:hypothetical protein
MGGAICCGPIRLARNSILHSLGEVGVYIRLRCIVGVECTHVVIDSSQACLLIIRTPHFRFRYPEVHLRSVVISMAEPTSRRASSVDEAQTPLLENMVVGVPPVFQGLTREIDQLGEQPLLGPKAEFPSRE